MDDKIKVEVNEKINPITAALHDMARSLGSKSDEDGTYHEAKITDRETGKTSSGIGSNQEEAVKEATEKFLGK